MNTSTEISDLTKSLRWMVINDVVMGGVSESQITDENNSLIFSGNLSMENNGGFASVRALADTLDLSDYSGFKINVMGDGRTYQFRLRTNEGFDGIAFKQDFETVKDSWVEVELPFNEFLPTYRGKILNNVKPLETNSIRQFAFLIADYIEGPFRLTIKDIEVYK